VRRTFNIKNRCVGGEHPCFLIAEVAQAHDGNINTAHAFIDSVAGTGFDAIKFQTHIADAESSSFEKWRVNFSRQDVSRYDYWKRMEFSKGQWSELKRHAEDVGLAFLSSPFSTQAVDMLMEIGVGAWKVASGELRNEILIGKIIETGLPVMLSCGMSTLDDVEVTVGQLKSAGVPFLVFQCTTSYPCPPEKVGLNVIDEIRRRFECDSGISDHSGTIWPGLAAAVMGAKAVEVHVIWDRGMFGPDTPASLTFPEIKQMSSGIRFLEMAMKNPVDKGAEAVRMGELRNLFGQSLVAARTIQGGAQIERADITSRKPVIGIPASDLSAVLGRSARHGITAGQFIRPEDLL